MLKQFKANFPVLLILLLLANTVQAKNKYAVRSPDGKIVCTVQVKNGTVCYSVLLGNRTVVQESPLGLSFLQQDNSIGLKISAAKSSSAVERYNLPVGKTSHVADAYNQLLLSCESADGKGIPIQIIFRIFNDAVAFRYQLPENGVAKDFVITAENSSFNFPENTKIRALFFPNYTSSHEGIYQKANLEDVPADTLIDLPALFEYPNQLFVAVTEANLTDYAGMYLSRVSGSTSMFSTRLSPHPEDSMAKVSGRFPHPTPWRVMLISDRMGDLIESTVLTSLSDACEIADLSWLKPGTSTFPWWNGNIVPDTINAPGNNFVTNKYYIDFCARNNITYHSVVEYGLHQWYMDDGVGFQPGPHADVTTPVPGLDMKEICDYAHSKGVDVRVWVHWAALYPKLDSAFALFEQWGLSGMMVDFMDRDDQEMVKIQEEILRKAAQHHLHIQFHGAYKNTGRQRTWPNEFTREGTMNYECNKWGNYITPDQDIDMPFTRLLAGSTDYHLGGLRAAKKEDIQPNYSRPLMLGTRAHMLAMYIVLESTLQMVCDYPDAYEGQTGFEFLTSIPTTWDETRVIQAVPDEYVIIARRKSDDWYVGAITNYENREIEFSLDFLGPGNYQAVLFRDNEHTKQDPNQLTKENRQLSKADTLNLQLSAGGGAVIHISQQQ